MEEQGVHGGAQTFTRRRFLQVAGGTGAAIALVGAGVPVFSEPDGQAAQAASATPSVSYSTEELVAMRHRRHRNQALGGYVDPSDPFHRCECGCTSGLFAHHFDSGRKTWL